MTLDDAILIQDALECQRKGMTREQFVACVKVPFQALNAQAYDDAIAYSHNCGNSRKALNHIDRQIAKARSEFFPL